MGLEKADAYTQERANYGTFMHGQIEKLLVNRSYDLDLLKAELAKYIEREQQTQRFISLSSGKPCPQRIGRKPPNGQGEP